MQSVLGWDRTLLNDMHGKRDVEDARQLVPQVGGSFGGVSAIREWRRSSPPRESAADARLFHGDGSQQAHGKAVAYFPHGAAKIRGCRLLHPKVRRGTSPRLVSYPCLAYYACVNARFPMNSSISGSRPYFLSSWL